MQLCPSSTFFITIPKAMRALETLVILMAVAAVAMEDQEMVVRVTEVQVNRSMQNYCVNTRSSFETIFGG